MKTNLSEDQAIALSELIYQGNKIGAIKRYREHTHVGLKEAKEEVERIESALRLEAPERFSVTPAKSGCFGAAAALCLTATVVTLWLTQA